MYQALPAGIFTNFSYFVNFIYFVYLRKCHKKKKKRGGGGGGAEKEGEKNKTGDQGMNWDVSTGKS